jgi:aryl-alcohol dehydrogenase-like predicted oxidoreductase
MGAPQRTEELAYTGMCGVERGVVMSMRYKLLGRTGLRVSELCLGAMIFGDHRGGWGASKDEAARIVERFAQAGGNFVDTANSYAGGESERIVGELVAAERERWVLSTKYTLSMRPDDPNGGGAHRKSLVQSLEASLRRLGTDYLDLYWVHIWDAFTPVEEVVRALDDVVSAGKVLYVGISDTPAWIVAQAVTLADLRGWTRFAGLQVPYSLVERSVERELLPMAQALELTVTAWSPLGGGLLTGRYGSDRERPEGTRIAALGQGSLTDRNLAIADAVNAVAAERGASSAQVAIAWVRAQQARSVVVPILGVRRREQLEDNLGALELELTPEELARLEDVSRIELGFPHDFGADRLAYGSTRPLIDSHRAYRPGPRKEKA